MQILIQNAYATTNIAANPMVTMPIAIAYPRDPYVATPLDLWVALAVDELLVLDEDVSLPLDPVGVELAPVPVGVATSTSTEGVPAAPVVPVAVAPLVVDVNERELCTTILGPPETMVKSPDSVSVSFVPGAFNELKRI